MNNKPIMLHVTNDAFFRLLRGEKKFEYRPFSRYYARRLEKLRDYIAYMRSNKGPSYDPPVYIEFCRAYAKRDQYESYIMYKIRNVKLIRLWDAEDYATLKNLYPRHTVWDFFYEIELAR